jgi:hypothetical protein
MRRLPTCRSSRPASQHIQNRRKQGSRPDPILSPLSSKAILHDIGGKCVGDCFALRIPNKPEPVADLASAAAREQFQDFTQAPADVLNLRRGLGWKGDGRLGFVGFDFRAQVLPRA